MRTVPQSVAFLLLVTGCAPEPAVCFSVVYDRPFMVTVDGDIAGWHGANDPVDVCVGEDQDVSVFMVPLL